MLNRNSTIQFFFCYNFQPSLQHILSFKLNATLITIIYDASFLNESNEKNMIKIKIFVYKKFYLKHRMNLTLPCLYLKNKNTYKMILIIVL
jgi:hypothetical protein